MSGKMAHYGGTELPLCQVPLVHVGQEIPRALYDGKTRHGPWGYLCSECFRRLGVGLGRGGVSGSCSTLPGGGELA